MKRSLIMLPIVSLLFITSCAQKPIEEESNVTMTSQTNYEPPVYLDEKKDVLANKPNFMVVNQANVIEHVQQKLKYLGYKPGMADGVVGPHTSTAIIKFQKANGLVVTGQLNEATIKALNLDPRFIGTRGSEVFAE